MEVLFQAFVELFTPVRLLLTLLGSVLGLVMGAIPGLSGGMAMILLLPLTFSLDPVTSMVLLCAVNIGGQSGGYVGSVLLGIPGTNSSIATVYDGYEMTKQGDPVKALSICAAANFIGTVPGVFIAIALCQILGKVAVMLGPWEIFAFGCSAIVMIITLSEGDVRKGLIAAGVGLAITCIGYAPVCSTNRYTFGLYHLAGGFERVNVILGIFAGRTIFMEFVRGQRLKGDVILPKVEKFKLPFKDIIDNMGNIIRSFVSGLIIGFLPGLGGALSNVVAYATEKKISKHPEQFGTGCTAGVWAPEVANNSSVGGAFIPMITLGIPGDGPTAYLLMALTIAGIDAGPLLMRNEPIVVNIIFATTLLGAVLLLIVQVWGMRLFPLMLKTPYQYLYPAIIALCFTGAYVSVGSISSALILIMFTLLGVWFAYAGLPATPFLIAYILGPILERNFRHAVTVSPDWGYLSFFTRPVSCTLIVIILFLLFWPLIKKAIMNRNAKFKALMDQVGEDDD